MYGSESERGELRREWLSLGSITRVCFVATILAPVIQLIGHMLKASGVGYLTETIVVFWICTLAILMSQVWFVSCVRHKCEQLAAEGMAWKRKYQGFLRKVKKAIKGSRLRKAQIDHIESYIAMSLVCRGSDFRTCPPEPIQRTVQKHLNNLVSNLRNDIGPIHKHNIYAFVAVPIAPDKFQIIGASSNSRLNGDNTIGDNVASMSFQIDDFIPFSTAWVEDQNTGTWVNDAVTCESYISMLGACYGSDYAIAIRPIRHQIKSRKNKKCHELAGFLIICVSASKLEPQRVFLDDHGKVDQALTQTMAGVADRIFWEIKRGTPAAPENLIGIEGTEFALDKTYLPFMKGLHIAFCGDSPGHEYGCKVSHNHILSHL